jgi:glycine/D-amino acid oxidase-like deaminating enzyme
MPTLSSAEHEDDTADLDSDNRTDYARMIPLGWSARSECPKHVAEHGQGGLKRIPDELADPQSSAHDLVAALTELGVVRIADYV